MVSIRHCSWGKIICHVSFYEIVFAHQKFKTKIDNMPRNKEEQIFEPLTLI